VNERQPGFQFEFMRFQNPPARPMDPNRSPADIGYQRVSLWVQNFDGVLGRLGERGIPFSPPFDDGRGRRVCIRDPNGVLLELLEKDIAPPGAEDGELYALPVRTRALSLSVTSLPAAERYFSEVLGMTHTDVQLHTPEMEGSWDLEGANRQVSVYAAEHHFVELVEYTSPRGRPFPPDRQIGDAGIYHMALRFPDAESVRATYREAIDSGQGANSEPVALGVATVVYMRALEGFLVEHLHYHPCIGRFIGFKKQELLR
jgi:catechol 2,3-dioxygenase-like lactoylglutathione lyase family enzyme